MKERVTVCLCAYNHEAYIRDALDRLAEQTFKDFKVIACDDGSTDATYDILKEYESGKLAGKLTVLTHPGRANRGIYTTYNVCLEQADTEFFMGHASDDFLEHGALEYLVGLMDKNPEADFAYGQCKLVDDKGCDLHRHDGVEDIGAGLQGAEVLMTRNPVRETTLFYRSACKPVLTSRPSGLVYGDWYQNVLLFLEKCGIHYEQPAINYRVHGRNISLAAGSSLARERESEAFAALSSNPIVTSHPSLRFSLLARLHAVEHPSCSGLSVRKEAHDALEQIADEAKRAQIVRQGWGSCKADSELVRFISMLPWSAGARLLLEMGSVAACSQVRRIVCAAPASIRLRLISQLWVSLMLRALISLRDFGGCVCASLRI